MKSLLVLGAGEYSLHVINEVRAAGYRTVVVDRDASAPGLAIADAPHPVDFADASALCRLAAAERVAGVLALNEFGVRAAGAVNAELGLRGVTPVTAELARDKARMRRRWSRDGLAQPGFRVVTDITEAHRAAAELGLPLVVKPAESGGAGRGVSVVREAAELDWALRFSLASALDGRVIVEQFLDGTEMTVETMSVDGEVHVLASSDKVKPPLRTRVATRLRYPPQLTRAPLAEVHDLASRAVASLELADGPGHVELIVTAGGPRLVEMGARGGGGHVFSMVVEAATGVPFVRESARVVAGGDADLRIRYTRGCVYLFFVPEHGVIRAIRGVDRARTMPGVLALGVTRRPGDVVAGLVNSMQRSGYAVVTGRDRAQAIHRADAVAATVVFELDPVPAAHA